MSNKNAKWLGTNRGQLTWLGRNSLTRSILQGLSNLKENTGESNKSKKRECKKANIINI